MKKILTKLGLSLIIIIASVIAWLLLILICIKEGSYGRTAPYWVLIAPLIGMFFLGNVWFSGWETKNDSGEKPTTPNDDQRSNDAV